MEASMSSNEMNATATGIDLWRVQLPTGEMRAMSLDALDDAFQSGLITESTPVLPPGATAWTKLADAAGLDEEPPSEPIAPSLAPLAVSVLTFDESTADATPYEQQRAAALAALDLDALPDTAFKAKKGRLFAGIGMALLLAGGIGFAATKVNLPGSATNALTAQQRAAAAQQAPAAAVDLDEATRRAATLNEEQKKRLAEFDKANAEREAQKKKDRPAPPPSPRARGAKEKTSQPFVNSGNKYDPLNGAL
jgi:DNA segregation ATPase FtsK/SpoIIIE-like protein